MLRKFFFLLVVLAVVGTVMYFVGQEDVRRVVDTVISRFRQTAVDEIGNRRFAVTRAQVLFKERVARGDNLSAGPCLAEDLILNWSADIVHQPRVAADDYDVNRCRNHISGATKHLVEITEDGFIVSAK